MEKKKIWLIHGNGFGMKNRSEFFEQTEKDAQYGKKQK